MKPVASILALVLAMTPALAFAGPKDKPHHGGKHAVHAGQAHTISRAHAQPASHKSSVAKGDAKAEKPGKDVVPAHHKTTKGMPAKPGMKADAKKAEPKKDEARDIIPAVAIAPAHDMKVDGKIDRDRAPRSSADEKKKHPPRRSHRTKK
jgi:hypothetical protein